jgi:hypothetical protein
MNEEDLKSKGFCIPPGVMFFTEKQLKSFSNALNRQAAGKSIEQINREIMQNIIHDKYNKDS